MKALRITCAAVILAVAAAPSFAGGHSDPAAAALNARKAHMNLYAFNLGPLGNMARGNLDYDAEAAQAAADNLAALSSMSQQGYWLPGTDSESLEGSRSLPAIWEEGSDVGAKAGAYVEAVMALQAVAGTGLEPLQAAIGPVGAACGACHESYRVPNN